MMSIQAFRFGGVFEEIIKSLDNRQTLLHSEIEHADREINREERAIDKWRNDMDHLQGLLRFDDSDCVEKHKQSKNKTFPGSGAGAWFLEGGVYTEWRDYRSVESGRLLWLHGPRKSIYRIFSPAC